VLELAQKDAGSQKTKF